MRFLRFLLLAALWSPFFAFASLVVNNGSVGVVANGSNYIVQDGSGGLAYAGRTWTNPSTRGGAVALAESYTGKIAGGTISVVARRAIPAAMAISAAKQSFLIGCQAGTELSGYLGLGTPNSSRVGCNVTDWLFDEGQPPQSVDNYCVSRSGVSACGATVADSVNNAAQQATQNGKPFGPGSGRACRIQGAITTTAALYCETAKGNGTYAFWDQLTPGKTTVTQCPASIDALDPAYSVPAGSPPGPDGKCPTGRYNPIDAATAQSRMDAYADFSKASNVLNKVLENGGTISVSGERDLSGTSSVVGTPTTSTTTNPDGSVTTTTTTPSISYTYNGNTISVTNNSTTTTTTCTAAGSCSSSTTDTKNDESGSPTDTGMPSVPKLYEQKYPDGVKGVWDSYSTSIGQIPLIAWVKSLSPSFADGGCPVWIIPIDVLGIRTSGDVSIPCWLWGVLKLIFNISALLAARKLIFGG